MSEAIQEPLRADMFDPVCPSNLSPIRFGDKWAGMIIRCLEGGPRRFSELRVPLHGITAKVLTQSLRTLERDGLISRTEYETPLRRVTYDLTPLGRSMLVPMDAACAWTAANWEELLDAREASTDLNRTA
ncbi:winged helix-turn-helix transcriptional regulator [Embleya sp. NPDC008237]|uniref:winged helix-turn-helix transcriptional regulator n=1 Tax=Embleya sp. NPDC008237 TaxID=3363978 RepID=UPI0036E5272D